VSAATLSGGWLWGAVLPEDRAEVMYHYYEGDDVRVSGPAVEVRKGFAQSVSLHAGYYADTISGASVDVVTTASPYRERRDEESVGVDYLHGDSLISLSYTRSDENDHDADTVDLSVAQEMFGGMSTVTLGYTRGYETVGKVDTDFSEDVDRFQYRLGLSQVLTKRLLVDLSYELITDRGFLNNPYRKVRLRQGSVVTFSESERYPATHTSHTVALTARRYWEPGIAGSIGYRYYRDTWGVDAHTVELDYSQYLGKRWLLDLDYRYYTQTSATFYRDLFDAPLNFMARDKELATFSSHTVGGRITYTFLDHPWRFLDRGTANLAYEYTHFNYDDFTDVRTGDLFDFGANVVQLYLSVWY